jgi:hypothetical protein
MTTSQQTAVERLRRALGVEVAEEQLCADLEALDDAVFNLSTINETNTVDDLQGAREDVRQALDDVSASAAEVSGARVNNLEAAYEALMRRSPMWKAARPWPRYRRTFRTQPWTCCLPALSWATGTVAGRRPHSRRAPAPRLWVLRRLSEMVGACTVGYETTEDGGQMTCSLRVPRVRWT